MFAGWLSIVSHSSCSTSAILKKICPMSSKYWNRVIITVYLVFVVICGKWSKISNTFLALFSKKIMVTRAGIHKKSITNRKDPDQAAASGAVWFGSARFVYAFGQGTSIWNFRTFIISKDIWPQIWNDSYYYAYYKFFRVEFQDLGNFEISPMTYSDNGCFTNWQDWSWRGLYDKMINKWFKLFY